MIDPFADDLFSYYAILHIPSGGYLSFIKSRDTKYTTSIFLKDKDTAERVLKQLSNNSTYLLGCPLNYFCFGESTQSLASYSTSSLYRPAFDIAEFELITIPADSIQRPEHCII